MGAPLFLLKIVHADANETLAVMPGGGPLEADLVESVVKGILDTEVIEDCVAQILARGVRFRTQDHIEQDIRDGITEVLERRLRIGTTNAISRLKKQTRYLVT